LAALAFVNSSYVKKGAVRVEEEVARFVAVPEGFVERFQAVISGSDSQTVLGDLKTLIKSVDAAIIECGCNQGHMHGRTEGRTVSSESASGLYEELKSTYNKLRDACDRRDQAKAFFAVNAVVREVADLLGVSYGCHGFPDLHTPLCEQSYELLKRRAAAHEAMLVSLLKLHGVPSTEFAGIDEFCSSLNYNFRRSL